LGRFVSFAYPNFVGTIQSFVDYFLATPLFANIYRRKPYRIDDEIYEEKVFTPRDAYGWLNNNPHLGKQVLYGSRLNSDDDLVWGFNYPGNFPLKTKTSNTYKAIWEMKQKLRDNGVLCFDDGYFLAIKAIAKYPILKKLLRLRFRYVFGDESVDEMQDMDKHQYDLLEELFYDNGGCNVVFQRIGDKNQAIFSGMVKLEDFWKSDGRKELPIYGSCRFSDEIASIVKCFALKPQPIEGKAPYKSIKPYLLIYKDNTILNVLPKFVDLVKEKLATNETVNLVGKIKAIGWRKSVEDGKIAIKNYFPQFNDDIHTNKIDYASLKGYLHNAKATNFHKNTLAESRKNILNAFLKVLRYENISGQDGRYYSKRRLMNFLKDETPGFYEKFKLKLYIWCKDIYRGNISEVIKETKEVVPNFLQEVFNRKVIFDKTRQFNDDEPSENIECEKPEGEEYAEAQNIYEKDGYSVEVGTIHSIKGETHAATLYMETYYQNDIRKRGEYISYESQRLKEFFKGNVATGNEGNRVKESLKMAYVGMSRPTHLLCVAVHEKHVKDYLHDIPDDKWEKIKI